ncbi:MAG TPA: Asd/ArgC dimerization domain-containing protein, partial [Planctomycetota bacterium]|nr:Asd/ArgC dimerization domain-containing protein [Planctomycetota bacterium]
KEKHTCPELLADAVYGLSELFRESLLSARLIANPGCYATSAIMGAAPFIATHWADGNGIIVDSWSGLSGAGGQYNAATRNTFLDITDNGRAYGIGTHKHTPEIEITLYNLGGDKSVTGVLFTPHLLPIDRGILTTIYLRPREGTPEPSTAAGLELMRSFYKDQPFVRVVDDASSVEIAHVRGTNRIEMSCAWVPRSKTWVVMTAIDNLVKGAYGQAIQNMNIRFGLGDTTGLLNRSI